jgi:nitrogen regulatory protein P-II 2
MTFESEAPDAPRHDGPTSSEAARPDSSPPDPPARSPMTLVTIVAERILRDRVLEGIRKAGSRGFTLTDVTGEGSRLIHAHEWEGPSVKVETLVSPEVAERIVAMVAERYFEHHAVIVYTAEVQVVRARRFLPESGPAWGQDRATDDG